MTDDAADAARRAMIAEVYDQLRALARHLERGGHATLDPTGLVHEAWLKLQVHGGEYVDRAHFAAVAARAMRQVLVDRARRRDADKRGGGLHRTTLSGVGAEGEVDLVDLVRALDELEAMDPRGARIVELRFLGGLTADEVADELGLSRSAVQQSWRLSRAWLLARLSG
jgi:RNA polymerase sigma factor (TIGR02999 family)